MLGRKLCLQSALQAIDMFTEVYGDAKERGKDMRKYRWQRNRLVWWLEHANWTLQHM